MAINHGSILALALFTVTMPGPGVAGDLVVRVTDMAGEPVAHAAVSLRAAANGSHAPGGDAGRSEPFIDQQGKQFTPWVLSVSAGTPVGFVNHDDITHHIYSFSPARRFSFRLQSGEKHAPLSFNEPGVVVLGCNIHDWMVGYVHVTDADFTATTDAAGRARFAGLAAGNWEVELWHPGLAGGTTPARHVALDASSAQLDIRLEHPLQETGPRRPLDDSAYALP